MAGEGLTLLSSVPALAVRLQAPRIEPRFNICPPVPHMAAEFACAWSFSQVSPPIDRGQRQVEEVGKFLGTHHLVLIC